MSRSSNSRYPIFSQIKQQYKNLRPFAKQKYVANIVKISATGAIFVLYHSMLHLTLILGNTSVRLKRQPHFTRKMQTSLVLLTTKFSFGSHSCSECEPKLATTLIPHCYSSIFHANISTCDSLFGRLRLSI